MHGIQLLLRQSKVEHVLVSVLFWRRDASFVGLGRANEGRLGAFVRVHCGRESVPELDVRFVLARLAVFFAVRTWFVKNGSNASCKSM